MGISDYDNILFSSFFKYCRINAFIHMDNGGDIRSVNKAFTDYFGWTIEDLKGNNFSVLFTPEDRVLNKPYNELEKVRASGQATDKNYLLHKGGGRSWVSGESIAFETGSGVVDIVKIIQDINIEKESETSISLKDNFNAHILNAIDDIVVVLDENMKLVKFNPAFEQLTARLQAGEIKDFGDFIAHYDFTGTLLKNIRAVAQTGVSFKNYYIEMASLSGMRYFDLSCQPVELSAGVTDVLITGRDITAQKMMEREKEDIFDFVAHELKNPLAAIQLNLELLQEAVSAEKKENAQNLLNKTTGNIARLNAMAKELYDATRVAGKGLQLVIAPFNFCTMLEDAVTMASSLWPDFDFTFNCPSGVMYNGDKYRLSQVVGNYLSNAAKYGGEKKAVHVGVTISNHEIIVDVKDTGTGIPASELPYVFERFFRAEKTKHLAGVGMGLFLCRQIIVAHHGKVWAESQEGKGSSFYFSLPLQQ